MMREAVKKQKHLPQTSKKGIRNQCQKTLNLVSILGPLAQPKLTKKTFKNRSQKGCKICIHFGIDFYRFGGPRWAARGGPTKGQRTNLFDHKSALAPQPAPRPPKTLPRPPQDPPQDPQRHRKSIKKTIGKIEPKSSQKHLQPY